MSIPPPDSRIEKLVKIEKHGPSNTKEAQPELSDAGRALIVRRASEIDAERVEWLWQDRIAIGKQTCIGGDPAMGKSQFAIHTAAAVTTGGAWPCGEGRAIRGYVIILNAEDSDADTIVPRLMAAGADLERVFIVRAVQTEDGKGRKTFNLQSDLDLLEKKIQEIKDVRLVIIDPLSSYMGRSDSHKNAEVRQVLEPVGEMATRMRVAVLTITHFSKTGANSPTKALHRFIGSIAFVGAARVAFAVIEDPNDKNRRLFLHVKNNLAPPPRGLAFTLEQRVAVPTKDSDDAIYASAIVWEDEPVSKTADEALSAEKGDETTAKDAAVDFLRAVLKPGPVDVRDLEQQARDAGLLGESQRINNAKPFRSAKETLGVKSSKGAFGSGWTWSLPNISQEAKSGVTHQETQTILPSSDAPTKGPALEVEIRHLRENDLTRSGSQDVPRRLR
jgi:putative DNA primase/helicase